jgi:pimeloyl-ACP methyl ester carboxylesterase
MSVHPPAGFARRFLAVSGARFHVVDGGAGPPVMLVGGWPQSWYCWRHVMPRLAARRRVIAVDPPGLGESDPPAAGDTASVVAAFAALVEALALGPVPFVGYDIGAWIGYALAARHPAAVERLVLIDAAIPGITPPAGYALTPVHAARTWHFYFNAQPELPEALIVGRERVFLEWLFRARSANRAAIEPAAVDEYVRLYSRTDAWRHALMYYRAIFETAAQNRATATSTLAQPVLGVGGGAWLGELMKQAIEPVCADLRFEVIPDCGHFVPEEAPERLAALLLEFL